MRAWLMENWGNLLIIGVLVSLVAVIVFFELRAKKQGKRGCAHGCAGCAMQGLCHDKKTDEKSN